MAAARYRKTLGCSLREESQQELPQRAHQRPLREANTSAVARHATPGGARSVEPGRQSQVLQRQLDSIPSVALGTAMLTREPVEGLTRRFGSKADVRRCPLLTSSGHTRGVNP